VLDVHGGENVDPGIQQFENVFVAFTMLAAFDVGMRQFVHQRDPGLAGENGVDIHLFEDRSLVVDLLPRHYFQVRDQLPNRFPPVGFYDSDHHIFAAGVPANRFGQHGMGLAHPGSISQEELEPASLVRRRDFLQPLLGGLGHREYCR
jgi:hypothetical protein